MGASTERTGQRCQQVSWRHVSHPPTHPPTPRRAQVKGFNVRRWMKDHAKKVPALLEQLAKLVNAGKLQAAFTECAIRGGIRALCR